MQRRTRQRDAIREVLRHARRPLSPQEILAAAEAEVPSLGLATVYRNIKALVGDGWLHPVELPGVPDRYELANQAHHHHFHCQRCDRVYDIAGCPGRLDDLAPSGFEVESHEIILYGLCAECSTAGAQAD